MSSDDPISQPPESVQTDTDALAPSFLVFPGPPPIDPPAVPPRPRSLTFPLHPNFWWAILWCLALQMFTQVPGAVVMIVILVVVAVAAPSLLPMDQLRNSESLMQTPVGQFSLGASLIVAHGLIICFALLLLRIIAGRDWRRQVALRLPSVSHFFLVLLIAPAFMILAGGAYAAMGSEYVYVPGTGEDLPGVAAFLLVLSAGVILLGLGAGMVHLCGIELPRALAGQIVLALVLVAAARFPAVWAYVELRDFFRGTALAAVKMDGMKQIEALFSQWPAAIAIFTIGVMPGLSEELWCRAFLGRGLVGKHGLFWGVLGTSFLFGAIHVDPRQGTMAMIVGVMIHYVYLTTRSLLLPMLLHFLNNSMAVVIPRFPLPTELDRATGETAWPMIAGAGCLLLAAVWALYESRARLATEEGRLPWRPAHPGVACPPPDSGTQVQAPRPSALALVLLALGIAALVGGVGLSMVLLESEK